MKDDLVSSFGLAIGLRVGDGGKSSLTAEGVQLICDFGSIKLTPIIENHCAGDAKASDDVSPDEFSYLNCGDGGDGFCFYPLGKLVHHYKKVFALTRGFGEGPKYVHAPRSKW